jgi:hypothetical protein
MSDGFNWDSEIPTEEEIQSVSKKAVSEAVAQKPQPIQTQQPTYEEDMEEELSVDETVDEYEFLTNARLRLEQGRLYEMFLKHNLFGDVDCDPRAVANVQRELKDFIQERLEILLGLKPDPKLVRLRQEESGPFNSLEIDILKKVISRISGGVSEHTEDAIRYSTAPVKTDTLKTLSSPKTSSIKPLQKKPSEGNSLRQQQKIAPREKAVTQVKVEPPKKEELNRPNKPLSEWTKAEKEERNRQIALEQAARKAPPGRNHVPMLSYDQQILHYGTQSNKYAGNGLVSKIIQSLPKGDN